MAFRAEFLNAWARLKKICGWKTTISAALFTLAAVCILPGDAKAQTTAGVRDLTQRATYVVRARCVGVLSTVDADMVWTLSTFELTEAWKGEPPPRFTVRFPGGAAPSLRMTVVGAPKFAEGEDVVLFMTEYRGRQMNIVGWAEGIYRIRKGVRSGIEKAVQEQVDDAGFAAPSAERRKGERRSIPLATLRGMVEQAKQ